MTDLLIFGGVAFWLAFAALAGVLIYATHVYRPFLSAFVVAGLVYLVGWAASDSPVPDYGIIDWLLIALAYLAIGMFYALFSWWRLVTQMRAFIDQWKPDAKIARSFEDQLRYSLGANFPDGSDSDTYSRMRLPPHPSDYMFRVTTWIAYWPAHLLTRVLGDGLVKLLEWISGLLSGVMRRISSAAFDGWTVPVRPEPAHDAAADAIERSVTDARAKKSPLRG